MIRYPISALGQHGVVQDVLPHELPLNAWSGGRNVRFFDGFVEKFLGHTQVFGAPSVAPYFLLPAVSGTSFFWLYAGLTKVYVWNGSAHTNITRQTGAVDVDYAATADKNWTGCVLGGIPILNNGVDAPQMWNPQTVATKLAALTNWPANTTCGAMRAFKQFLVALDVTKTGTRYPYMVKWSHPAAPGVVPSSWDETLATVDAGEWELKETKGYVLDCLRLKDTNVIYKEDSVHGMQFIGGTQIFRFFEMFPDFGAMSRRCAAVLTNGSHVVLTPDDIVVHNGQTAQSIIESRVRRELFKDINPDTTSRSFVVVTPRKEVWFCYARRDAMFPNRALVWNFVSNTFGFRDLPNVAHIELGVNLSSAGTPDSWDADTAEWDADATAWNDATFTTAFRRALMAAPVDTQILLADNDASFNGTAMTSYVERTGLGLPLKKDAPPDFDTRKFLTRLWPRIEGTLGGQVNVYVGSQDKIGGPITWGSPQVYTIGTSDSVEPLVNARLHAIRYESTSNIEWRLHGHEVEIRAAGRIT